MKKATLLALAIWSLSLPAAAEDDVHISNAWARASILASRPGAAYATIESASGDRLLGITATTAERVVIHAVVSEGDVTRMKPVDALDIPAGQKIELSPGGMHLMLMGLHKKLVEGATFPISLEFEKAGVMTVDVSVLGVAATGPETSGPGSQQ